MTDRQRVLFLCTGNSARSQMAEGLMRHLAGDRFEVFSAGSRPAERVHPLAVETMSRRGIDISEHYPKLLEEFLDQSFDYLITTCDGARESCPFFPGARRQLHWSLPDPAAAEGSETERLAAFAAVAEDLESRIGKLLEEASLAVPNPPEHKHN